MAVNLKKHEAEIQDAWKKVVDDSESYDWALFGYEGKSYDLKVVRYFCSRRKKEEENMNIFIIKILHSCRKQSDPMVSRESQKSSTRAKCNMDSLKYTIQTRIYVNFC
jgi:hypothetical protein